MSQVVANESKHNTLNSLNVNLASLSKSYKYVHVAA